MMNSSESRPIGRFAPSPTGPLHSGSLVAALGSYLMAKRSGGLWLVRLEDLDAPRVVPGVADDILRTLEELGLRWDREVIRQSGRAPAYEAALERLRSQGLIYPCSCSRAEIARSSSAPHMGDEGPVYPGLCRKGSISSKRALSYRINVAAAEIGFHDLVHGYYCRNLADSAGDFVIKRADGPFAYHLAVVVDDGESGVTQIVRGSDLLPSTPRQIYLQRLLGFPSPSYAHLPLVTGPSGEKLSKRDNPVSLAACGDLQRVGPAFLEAALKFLGQKTGGLPKGLNNAEIVSWAVAHFDPDLILTHPAPFPLQLT